MKAEKSQVAGYGLHYHANNQLIPKIADRLLFQCLVDNVRFQLKQSPHSQTIFISNKQLGRLCGVDSGKTIPSALERLESLGLIQRHANAITVNCDFYVTVVQTYESLKTEDKAKFVADFIGKGPKVLEISNIKVQNMARMELLGMSGGSMSVAQSQEDWKLPTFSTFENKNDWKVPTISTSDSENVGNFQSNWKTPTSLETSNLIGIIQYLAQQIAKMLEVSNQYWSFPTLLESIGVGNFQSEIISALKMAFETGKLPDSVLFDPQKTLEVSNLIVGSFQSFCPKTLEVSNPVIRENEKRNEPRKIQKNRENGEVEQVEVEDDFSEEIKKGFERFSKVEVLDLEQPSEDFEKVEESYEDKVLQRAERSMRSRNPYKNKPFFPVESKHSVK